MEQAQYFPSDDPRELTLKGRTKLLTQLLDTKSEQPLRDRPVYTTLARLTDRQALDFYFARLNDQVYANLAMLPLRRPSLLDFLPWRRKSALERMKEAIKIAVDDHVDGMMTLTVCQMILDHHDAAAAYTYLNLAVAAMRPVVVEYYVHDALSRL